MTGRPQQPQYGVMIRPWFTRGRIRAAALLALALAVGIPLAGVLAQEEPQKGRVAKEALEAWKRAPIPAKPGEVAPLLKFRPAFKPLLITYRPGESLLKEDAALALRNLALRLAATLEKISIVAHSGDAQISTEEAVRISFQRAMLVRNYLMSQGIAVERIELEALPQAGSGHPDRVEISVIKD